jgi:hypothetical protein
VPDDPQTDDPQSTDSTDSNTSGHSIADFYDADPRRRNSEEIEFGDGWTRREDAHATYRVNLVLETGELYAVREPHRGGILARYFDQLGVEQADVDELRVTVLGVVDEAEAARLLDGWQEHMHGTHSLPWVEQQLSATRGQ